MKAFNTISKLAVILFIVVGLISCRQEPPSYAMMDETVYDIVSDREVVDEIAPESPMQEVVVISTDAPYWMVVSCPKWVKVEPVTGLGNGESTIVTLTIESNFGDQRKGAVKFVGGRSSFSLAVNQLGLSDSAERYAGGTGTEDDPWLISRPVHMLHMSEDLESGQTKYFKLTSDIDMQDLDWTPANNEAPYDKAIDFDGNGKVLSNFSCNVASMPSLLGVLNGSVRNVTFKGAEVGKSNVGYVGIIAGGVDKDQTAGTISNVTIDGCKVVGKQLTGAIVGNAGKTTFTDCVVRNSTITATGSGIGGICGFSTAEVTFDNCSVSFDAGKGIAASKYIGGIIGRATAGGSLKNCSAEITISGIDNLGGIVGGATNVAFHIENCAGVADIEGTGSYLGGVVGYIPVAGASIKNCCATGQLASSGGSYVGGIVGGIVGGSISNCYATNTLSGVKGQIGGIAGQANTSPSVSKCIAWNPSISVTLNDAGRYSCAAIVGVMYPLGIAADCVRKPGMTISGLYEEADPAKEIYKMNGVFDQDNITTDEPLKNNAGEPVSNEKIESPYKFPYHGKTAAADETISNVAVRIGWDTAVWDFTGDIPVLKSLKSE